VLLVVWSLIFDYLSVPLGDPVCHVVVMFLYMSATSIICVALIYIQRQPIEGSIVSNKRIETLCMLSDELHYYYYYILLRILYLYSVLTILCKEIFVLSLRRLCTLCVADVVSDIPYE